MPIKWSALKVSEAMDAVEKQLQCAEPFLEEAKKFTREALSIPNLPQYMRQRLNRLEDRIQASREYPAGCVGRVREDIPEGAIAEEKATLRHGTTQSLI